MQTFTNITSELLLSIRGRLKMSTFSWLYKQYTFSDPLPLPLKCADHTFVGSKTRVLRSTTFIVQKQKLTRLQSLQCDKWYLWQCIMIYRLQLILYTSKFNLNIYFLWIQRKYVQFHNMKLKMPNSQLLIGLETVRKPRMSTFISHQNCTSGLTPSPPLVYGLYTCENVDNYGWPLSALP